MQIYPFKYVQIHLNAVCSFANLCSRAWISFSWVLLFQSSNTAESINQSELNTGPDLPHIFEHFYFLAIHTDFNRSKSLHYQTCKSLKWWFLNTQKMKKNMAFILICSNIDIRLKYEEYDFQKSLYPLQLQVFFPCSLDACPSSLN